MRPAPLLAELLQQAHGLPESGEVQQGERGIGRDLCRSPAGIGPAQSHGGVRAVGQADDEVRINATAHAHDFTPLPVQRAMGMDDRDES